MACHIFVRLEGKCFRIRVQERSKETLKDVALRAAVLFLNDTYEIEDDSEVLVEKHMVEIRRLSENGIVLDLRDTVEASGIEDGANLDAALKTASKKFLAETFPDISMGDEAGSSASMQSQQSSWENGSVRRPIRNVASSRLKKIAESNHQQDNKHILGSITNGFNRLRLAESTGSQGGLPRSFSELSLTTNFSAQEIMAATEGFDPGKIIGTGGQATVYRAVLRGAHVAVKQFKDVSFQDLLSEVSSLQKLRHPNILLLMGCCEELNCLVSEYVPGGSLQDRLDPDSRGMYPIMTWFDRLRIAHDVASAVLYLHKSDVLHRDLKPANVLLDEHGRAKVVDMGLARTGVQTYAASGLRGTVGYIDPNYITSGMLRAASDTYAFGLILLQLFTDSDSVAKVHGLLEKCSKSEPRNLADALLVFMPAVIPPVDNFPPPEVISSSLKLALLCTEKNPFNRPDMEKLVVPALSQLLDLVGQPIKVNHAAHLVLEADRVAIVDPKKSVELYAQAAELKSPEANFKLAQCLEFGRGIDSDWEQSFHRYAASAEEGFVNAEFSIGRCFDDGVGVEISKKQAMDWYSKAAKKGHVLAQVALGYNLCCGGYGPELRSSGLVIVSAAVRKIDLEDPIGCFILGRCHDRGLGVEMDHERAVELFRRAASRGYALGQCWLGWCYYNGRGVTRDFVEAASWFRMAAEKGSPSGEFWLGECYEYGHGVEKNAEYAEELKQSAKEAGY